MGALLGSGLGFEVLRADTEPYYAFFASAVRPNWRDSQVLGYNLVLQIAREAGDEKAVEALSAIQPFEPTNPEHVAVRGKYLSQYRVGDFRTEGLEDAWLGYATKGKSPEFPPSTIRSVVAAMSFSRETIGTEVLTSDFDLTRDFPASSVPVHFLAGRYDYETPGELAEGYYELLEAPAKSFTWFENSAHDVNFDEPDKFSEILIRISREVLNSSN